MAGNTEVSLISENLKLQGFLDKKLFDTLKFSDLDTNRLFLGLHTTFCKPFLLIYLNGTPWRATGSYNLLLSQSGATASRTISKGLLGVFDAVLGPRINKIYHNSQNPEDYVILVSC